MAGFTPLVGNHFYKAVPQGYVCFSNEKSVLNMRKLVSFSVFVLVLANLAIAQQVTGVVKDQQGKGLAKATISLLKAKDSSVVKLVVTGENGLFSVSTGQPGNYLVSASYVGYVPVYSQVFELSG